VTALSPQVIATRSIVRRLLEGMDTSKEVRAYLKRFGGLERSRFAIVKVGGGVLAEAREDVAGALSFLQALGLIPVVVHGAGPQLDQALSEAGIALTRVEGQRVTPDVAMPIVAETVRRESLALASAMRQEGGAGLPLLSGVIEAEPLNEAKLGRVGKPVRVGVETVKSALDEGLIPLIPSLGETADGRLMNVNADSVVQALAHALQPYKLVFLTPTGGMLDERGEFISVVHLSSDYERLMAAPWVSGGMRLKLQEIAGLLQGLDPSASVSITRPQTFAKELFTHSGSGTLIRRGEAIHVVERGMDVDVRGLTQVIEAGFDRPLRSGWWEGLELESIIHSHSMRAAAVLTHLDDHALYLDKFAVLEDARGEGLAKALWDRVSERGPLLIWRSKANNPFNSFYMAASDGAVHKGAWTVFWRGDSDWSRLGARIEEVAQRPEDFLGEKAA
jgi:acetylglutamate kinase